MRLVIGHPLLALLFGALCSHGLASNRRRLVGGVAVAQAPSPAGPLLSAWLPWVPAGPLPGGALGDPQLCPPGDWLTKLTLAAGSAPLPTGRTASGVMTLQGRCSSGRALGYVGPRAGTPGVTYTAENVNVYDVDGFQALNGTGMAVLEGLLGVGRGAGAGFWAASCPSRMRVAGYQVRADTLVYQARFWCSCINCGCQCLEAWNYTSSKGNTFTVNGTCANPDGDWNTIYCYVNESTCAHNPISSNHGPWDACASANLTYTLDTDKTINYCNCQPSFNYTVPKTGQVLTSDGTCIDDDPADDLPPWCLVVEETCSAPPPRRNGVAWDICRGSPRDGSSTPSLEPGAPSPAPAPLIPHTSGCRCLAQWSYTPQSTAKKFTINGTCANPGNDNPVPWCYVDESTCANAPLPDAGGAYDNCPAEGSTTTYDTQKTVNFCSCLPVYNYTTPGGKVIVEEHGGCIRAAQQELPWCFVITATCVAPPENQKRGRYWDTCLKTGLEAKFGAAPALAPAPAMAALAPAGVQQLQDALRFTLTLSGPDANSWTLEHSSMVAAEAARLLAEPQAAPGAVSVVREVSASRGSDSASWGSAASSGGLPLPAVPGVCDWQIPVDQLQFDVRADGSDYELGSGAYGKVYRGVWNEVQPVAIKTLLNQTAAQQARFLREIALLRSCRSVHVVQFLGACIAPSGCTMLVTELMEGGALHDAIHASVVTWHVSGQQVALDAARGLAYLHSRRIAHLDIKSANVLLSREGKAKISDVGLARVVQATHISSLDAQGTFAYAAPELLGGANCAESADLYSFGVLLWELVTGELPRRGVLRPVLVPEECSEETEGLIQACMQSNPASRPSAKALVAQLQAGVMAMAPAECAWSPTRDPSEHESRSRQQLSRDLAFAAQARRMQTRHSDPSLKNLGTGLSPKSNPISSCRSVGCSPHPWLLHRSGARVTLYEREARCGGHTLTDDSPGYPVDLGFQVFNLTTYPNFVGLLECLGVDSQPSNMSFALSVDGGALEWGSDGLGALFAQRANAASPAFLRMVWDVLRFGREAPKVLRPEAAATYGSMSLGAYLIRHGYSEAFKRSYLLPMCAAVWSVPNVQVLEFPVAMLVRFWVNHHLLDVLQRPVWRVVKGRSRTYVDHILAELPDVRVNASVTKVTPAAAGRGPMLAAADASSAEEYDAVVFATHTDTTLAALGSDAPEAVRAVLGALPYADNRVYLHTDVALMPRRRATWASWNCIQGSGAGADAAPVCVTYWLNRLQDLPAGAPDTFVTLNPPTPPATELTIRRLTLSHPVFGPGACEAQQALPSIQGMGGCYFAGAWAGYGFHEDGLKAGMAAAAALGAAIPWQPRATSPKLGVLDQLYLATFDGFARRALRLGRLRLILPTGEERCYGEEGVAACDRAPKGGRPPLAATVRVLRADFFRQVVARHDTGLGEAYMAGNFEADDLGGLMAVAVANARAIEARRGALGVANWLGARLLAAAHRRRANTLDGSRRNIEEHYDAGNDMYRLFLDATMTYSSGLHQPGDTLEQAQLRKMDALLAKARVTADDHVLEIGCGWGSLALRAVQTTGCRWTGITVSKQQLEEATARVQRAGLSDRITLLFCDYRELLGTYDKVISCEMVEAVGHENLPTYFSAISRALRPGGLAVIQAISGSDERYEAYRTSSDFIRTHIFPGGHMPCLGAMADAARGTGLSIQGCDDIGPHYADTLRSWRAAWEQRREDVLRLGYSERFWRKYRFYFAYCEAAFDARYIHNFQITWAKSAAAELSPLPAAPRGGNAAPMQIAASGKAGAAAPTDSVTQVLLAIYFFLAGWLLSQSRRLWIMPAASAVFAVIWAGADAACSALLAMYRDLEAEERAAWCMDIVHLLFSGGAAVGAATFVATAPAALDARWAPPPDGDAAGAADLLACVAAGFYGFQLWALVRHRLFRRSYVRLVHATLLLGLCSAAAAKAQSTPLLAAMLLSEAASALAVLGRLQARAGLSAASAARRFTEAAALAAQLPLRLALHAYLAAGVVAHPRAFAAQSYYWVAVAGCTYINAVNLRQAALATVTFL
ncbi:hypothetical protein WJX81_001503 [Elliptochloris bilobata]|uniref:Protein kinase domain-containing protein n=1 Tax=Elliptochloris bilobata TaxID=381761 RepID=A0AAW1QKE7_9CHLO